MPVSSFTRLSHFRPGAPTPSKPPGRVRGFQIPARKIFTPMAANAVAVAITCSSVSALHGPAITSGRFSSTPGNTMDFKSNFSMFLLIVVYV